MLIANLKKYTLPSLCLLPGAAALLNLPYFGPQTLTAYFLFTIVGCLVAVIIGIALLRSKISQADFLQDYVWIFTALTLYIFLHGIISNTINLTHYYWIACAVWLTAITLWQHSLQPANREAVKKIIFVAITVLACLESIIVALQCLKVYPSKNPLFTSTGSWVNPNVTAMFLALSLFALFKIISYHKMGYAGLALILPAILLLQCRSAYLVTTVFLFSAYWPKIANTLVSTFKINKSVFLTAAALISVLLIFILSFKFKSNSTNGRLQIWQNSIGLIGENPVTGHGFGMFEKDYNFYVAKNNLPSSDHVYMPYNDFMELAIEGGIIAVVLWLAFLVALVSHNFKNKDVLNIVAALLIIQLTNFGFQALPVFALFLLYIGVLSPTFLLPASKQKPLVYSRKFIPVSALACIIIGSLLLLNQSSLAKAFHEREEITSTNIPTDAVDAYEELRPTLNRFQSYHESYGDAFMQLKQYKPALAEYLAAAEVCSLPSVLEKCGMCYLQQKQYDSSTYYYTLVQNMQPYKFAPRVALLNVYEQQGDALHAHNKALEIINMQVKVQSPQVAQIKAYAQRILNVK